MRRRRSLIKGFGICCNVSAKKVSAIERRQRGAKRALGRSHTCISELGRAWRVESSVIEEEEKEQHTQQGCCAVGQV